jgi:hypothetical protein
MIVEHFCPFGVVVEISCTLHSLDLMPVNLLPIHDSKMALKGRRFQDIKDLKKNVTLMTVSCKF